MNSVTFTVATLSFRFYMASESSEPIVMLASIAVGRAPASAVAPLLSVTSGFPLNS